VRTTVDLVHRPDFTVRAVSCRGEPAGWSATEVHGDHGIVLVRRGRFRRQLAGHCVDADPTVAYLSAPGDEQRFAHPAGGDMCTSITVAPWLWQTLAGERARRHGSGVYVDARLHLAHRRVLAARGADHDYSLVEELLGLLAAAIGTVVPAARADRALVASAREAIGHDHPAARGLLPLAALLGVSPYRLSRAFSRELGVSLTRYRNRVRVGRVLDRLAGGERNLAALAADLGFADQAHMCRTVRQHAGHPPTAVRRLLAPVAGG
jgi:AraC-like DNA-binding protein